MNSSVSSRIKDTPRFVAIRSKSQLHARLKCMKSLDIWIAMTQKGLAGWKHKEMSDELQRRKDQIFQSSELISFLKD